MYIPDLTVNSKLHSIHHIAEVKWVTNNNWRWLLESYNLILLCRLKGYPKRVVFTSSCSFCLVILLLRHFVCVAMIWSKPARSYVDLIEWWGEFFRLPLRSVASDGNGSLLGSGLSNESWALSLYVSHLLFSSVSPSCVYIPPSL